MALTLGQSRPILWKYVSNVAYESAQDSDLKAFDLTLNRLCERLLIEGKWRTTYRRVILTSYGNKITLPRNLSTCLGVDPICPDGGWSGFPIRIYSRWFEFAAQGPGLTSDCARACSIRGLVPINDSAQTFVDPEFTSSASPPSSENPSIPPPQPPTFPGFYLRAKSTKGNGRGFTFIGGVDENGILIENNVKLDIANGTTTTTQLYTEMPFIEKAITPASVQFYSVDSGTAEETLLCVYAASETVPAYKRYVVPSAEDGSTFLCLCKLQYVPAINDADLIIPSVTDALVTGLQALQFRDRNDFERYGQYMGDAVTTLDTDLAEDESAEIPTFQMSRDYGAGNIYQVH